MSELTLELRGHIRGVLDAGAKVLSKRAAEMDDFQDWDGLLLCIDGIRGTVELAKLMDATASGREGEQQA